MSLRPVLRPVAIAANATRALSSSAPRRGGHSESHGSSEADTHESFFNSTWRNTFLVLAAGALIYPYLPSPQKGSASPSVSNDALTKDAQSDDAPFITRMLAKAMEGKSATWAERNVKHLELAGEVADTRLLFQEAERPKVWRLRFPQSFESASPHCIPVGSQADLSDLKIKKESE